MSALDAAVRSFRAAALWHERAASGELVRAYAVIWRSLQGNLNALTREVEAAKARGMTLDEAWFRQVSKGRLPQVQTLKGESFADAVARVQYRYQTLLAQTEEELRRYAQFAERTIAIEQRAAVVSALTNVDGLMGAALGTPPPGVLVNFNRLPTAAIEELTGALADGSPLAALFREIAPAGVRAASEALVTGLGRGLSPRAIARQLEKALNVAPRRALKISRQEINRSYRAASLESFRQNSDIVDGWTWYCSGGPRTCGVCFAKHGSFHKLSESMATHICCRCTQIPHCRSWAELGFPGIPDTSPTIEDGAALFARLDAADQRTILGSGKYQLWRDGELTLDDLVKRTRSAQWGPGLREATLGELRERERMVAD